tara:strand:- start:83138 stop:85621 length:2484 start_codon:yes stop_codon:yes gene_type:complete
MQSRALCGVYWPVPPNMPLNIFMTKYQRFVAWRYLMERERKLSSGILGFVGFCLWLAIGLGAACIWYPLSDNFLVPPPNAPTWVIGLVGLACALPFVALIAAALSAARGLNPTGHLLRGIYWSLLAVAAFGVYEKSISGAFSNVISAGIMALAALIALNAPASQNFMSEVQRGDGPQEMFSPQHGLGFSLGSLVWRFLLQAKGLLQRRFLLPLRVLLVAALLVGVYIGIRESQWAILIPDGGFGLYAIVAVCFLACLILLLAGLKGHLTVANCALVALLVAGILIIGMRFGAGVVEVRMNLGFLGGWSAYTPPMGMIMPALVAAAVAILAGVLLTARYFFTFFTTVSIGGVTIGTMALVIVLSVMSGFETDLREKILGFNAHIQISSNDELQFDGYRDVEAILETTDGVLGYTPFLTTEAYMSNHNNYGNVTLKGIDPARVASVTEIVHNLEKGDERALEKLWPLEEDGSIAGAPKALDPAEDFELGGPEDFSGGLEEIAEPEDFELDGPEDLSGGLDELPDAGPDDSDPVLYGGDSVASAPLSKPNWDVDLRPHDYIEPGIAVLDGVLVGRELVKTVNLYTDQEVRVISPLPDTSPDGLSIPRLKNFRVAGRFFSGMYEYDLKYVYCSLNALQDFLDLGDVVNGIEVRVEDPRNTAAIVENLQKSLGPGYRVQDWKELNRALFSALKLEKIAMFFILVIIVLVASFSIIGNLIMVVIEKAKEIAILKTLGSSNGGVMKIFITQGFFIGLVGTSLGVALGLGACYLGMTLGVPLDPDVYYIDKLPIQIEEGSVVAVAFAGLAISVVATIYPAFIAARMRPVKGLRWD